MVFEFLANKLPSFVDYLKLKKLKLSVASDVKK